MYLLELLLRKHCPSLSDHTLPQEHGLYSDVGEKARQSRKNKMIRMMMIIIMQLIFELMLGIMYTYKQ